MPFTYGTDDSRPSEPTTITRQCDEISGCGGEMEVTVYPDGSYEGGVFVGEVEHPAPGAHVVTERRVEDEWIGEDFEVEWSETVTEEFWLHDECVAPEDYDPDDVEHTVS